MDERQAYWSAQTSSRNRSSDPEFYSAKAAEHAALLTDTERQAGAVDLGCGAGELLLPLVDHMKVSAALDFSPAMLAEARAALAGHDISFFGDDVFDYLPTCHIPVWMTTGALNQYLPLANLQRLLDIFASNDAATSFMLFDCVDPVRYPLVEMGISYRPQHYVPTRSRSLRSRVGVAVHRARYALALATGRFDGPAVKLHSASMGYATTPRFWFEAAFERRIGIEIVSSRYYEYRYHVLLRKAPEHYG